MARIEVDNMDGFALERLFDQPALRKQAVRWKERPAEKRSFLAPGGYVIEVILQHNRVVDKQLLPPAMTPMPPIMMPR